MNKRNRQVFVEYRDNISPTSPLDRRTYTMTHSDDSGDLFVTIGLTYAKDKTGPLRDEVYLTWQRLGNKNLLYGEVLIDGEGITSNVKGRYDIFRREMPLALQAIYIADAPLFEAYPELKETPILINFKSTNPMYNKLYSYGTIGEYNTLPRSRFR